MVTFFTFPKPFNKKFTAIQTNAILSWRFLKPRPKVILFGSETGVDKFAHKYGVDLVSELEKNNYGTPLVNEAFKKVSIISNNKFTCFLNADIIVDPKITHVLQKISSRFDKFLIIARRWDSKVNFKIDFHKEDWFSKIETAAHKNGKLYSPLGIDLFIFRRGFFDSIPNFAIGRAVMDNWMVYYAKSLKIPVIDITNAITLVHQKHPIKRDFKNKTTSHNGIEFRENLRLASGYTCCFNTNDADYILDRNSVIHKKKPGMINYYSKIKRFVHKLVDPIYFSF